jgi:hypothetical protein
MPEVIAENVRFASACAAASTPDERSATLAGTLQNALRRSGGRIDATDSSTSIAIASAVQLCAGRAVRVTAGRERRSAELPLPRSLGEVYRFGQEFNCVSSVSTREAHAAFEVLPARGHGSLDRGPRLSRSAAQRLDRALDVARRAAIDERLRCVERGVRRALLVAHRLELCDRFGRHRERFIMLADAGAGDAEPLERVRDQHLEPSAPGFGEHLLEPRRRALIRPELEPVAREVQLRTERNAGDSRATRELLRRGQVLERAREVAHLFEK